MTTLGSVVYAFFERHLTAEKGLSPASVRSYRDALRLFLAFLAARCHRPITRLDLKDLTAERVREFLGHLEAERGNHIRTRNQRLAGLHTFFNYLAGQVPEMLAEAGNGIAQALAATKGVRCNHSENVSQHLDAAGEGALDKLTFRSKKFRLFQCGLQRRHQYFGRAGFVEEAKNVAAVYGIDGGLLVGISRQHHAHCVGRDFLNFFE